METFNVIVDRARQEIIMRFSGNEELLSNLSNMHPSNFSKPIGNMDYLAKLAQVDPESLARELVQFARHFKDYKSLLPSSPNDDGQNIYYESSDDEQSPGAVDACLVQ